MTSPDSPEQKIRQAAAAWAVRLDGREPAPERASALRRWLAEDPRHAPALELARRTWAELASLGQTPAMACPPATVARPLYSRRQRWLRRSAAVAALLLVVLCVPLGQRMLIPVLADHATGTGEIRQVTLPDGSRVELDAQSAIDVAYTGGERRIRLLRGAACFDVAPMGQGEQRPFVVERSGGTSRALGTRFVVGDMGTEARWVGVLEHSVEVALVSPPSKGLSRRVIGQGEMVRYSAAAGIEALTAEDLQRATSWQRGLLIFERQPLREVVAQLNRYRAGQIVITDRSLSSREVSGIFRLDSLDEALTTVTRELQARRTDFPGISLIY